MEQEKIKEIFSDEAFVTSILNMETAEEVQAALAEKGLELTLDEINSIKVALSNSEDGTLSEEDLEQVAGGFIATLCAVISTAVAVASGVQSAVRARW